MGSGLGTLRAVVSLGLGESGDTSPARIPWSTPGHSNTLKLNDIELN